jgi:predicted HicB family RNase H-like nuclease
MRELKESDEELVQLATRIPQRLVRRLKEFCVRKEISMQTFVRAALQEKLARGRARGSRG